MPVFPSVQTIRDLVRERFSQHGADASGELAETILIRGGLYCGRRFELGAFSAVWFVEEGELKIYFPDGSAEFPWQEVEMPAVAIRAAA